TDYGFLAEQAKRKGAPLDWFVIPPPIARSTAEGLARNAQHPYAAMLFYDFLISDAQPILASRAFVPASAKIESPVDRSQLKLIDSAAMLDQAKKWQELYQRTIIGPSRGASLFPPRGKRVTAPRDRVTALPPSAAPGAGSASARASSGFPRRRARSRTGRRSRESIRTA